MVKWPCVADCGGGMISLIYELIGNKNDDSTTSSQFI